MRSGPAQLQVTSPVVVQVRFMKPSGHSMLGTECRQPVFCGHLAVPRAVRRTWKLSLLPVDRVVHSKGRALPQPNCDAVCRCNASCAGNRRSWRSKTIRCQSPRDKRHQGALLLPVEQPTSDQSLPGPKRAEGQSGADDGLLFPARAHGNKPGGGLAPPHGAARGPSPSRLHR